MSRPTERPRPLGEDLALRFILPLIRLTLFSFSDVAEKYLRWSSKHEDFGTKSLNSDGHLITEDSVLPTTAPGGAPERNRCYQTPAYFIRSPPCARFARALGAPRTAHFAMPPLGAGALGIALELDITDSNLRVLPLMKPARACPA